MNPLFVISLDFELYWGVRDVLSLEAYRENLLGERRAVVALLDCFRRREIRATWATVGALFCANKQELVESLPRRLPRYVEGKLSPYEELDRLGDDEASDPFHYAPSLVRKILETPGQELATHTFGHYYCREDGQTAETFDADLESAMRAAERMGARLQSLVFPRNQDNPSYHAIMVQRGIRAYRSNGDHWAYSAATTVEPLAKRAFRLLDSHLPIAGARSARIRRGTGPLVDVPASAFLRPVNPRHRLLTAARRRRVMWAMETAARRGECFHLWWHPHNFGVNLGENLDSLAAILDHFEVLRRRYGMRSASMLDAAS